MTTADNSKKEKRKKRLTFLKTNRPFAFFALAVIIVLSCCIGTARGYISLKNDVADAYTNVKISEVDVKDNLTKMTVSASHLLAIYKAQAGEDTLYADSEAALSMLTNSIESPFRRGNCTKQLSDCIYYVHYALITNYYLDSQIKNSETSYYYDFESKLDQLSNAEKYNKAAKAYNKAAASFPLSLVVSDTAEVYN